MKPYALNPFLGLRSSVANPNGQGCSDCGNFVRNRIHGYLQNQGGYSKLYQSVPVECYPFPSSKVAGIVIKDISNFYVPDHGGKNINVCVGTYYNSSFG